MMKWINIIGFVFQFLSFWFAAPELLGSDTLKRFEEGLIKLMSRLPALLLGGGGVVFGLMMGIYGVYKGASADAQTNYTQTFFIIIGISVLYFVLILFYKKIERWIERKFAKPTIENLIKNNESRKTALMIGAVLFTVGFMCQLVVMVLT